MQVWLIMNVAYYHIFFIVIGIKKELFNSIHSIDVW